MTYQPDTYEPPEHGWTCFHCGETFAPYGIHVTRAREHFGPTPAHEPGCSIKLNAEDRSLLKELRAKQAELERYWAEDSDKDREIRRLQADHQVELRRAEEAGYARGVADAQLRDEDEASQCEHGCFPDQYCEDCSETRV